jgi:hypothetical protein
MFLATLEQGFEMSLQGAPVRGLLGSGVVVAVREIAGGRASCVERPVIQFYSCLEYYVHRVDFGTQNVLARV